MSGVSLKSVLWAHVVLLLLLALPRWALADGNEPLKLDCAAMPCAEVLPGAERFEPPKPDVAYLAGFDGAGELKGWVVLSTDVVDIKAYSGKPLVTLVGVTTEGVIGGARVIHHSEPILLVGIPEKKLFDFAAGYAGKHATAKVVVGKSPDPAAITVDIISGATVTVLAQNKTILDTARSLGSAVGVVKAEPPVPGHFVQGAEPLSWQAMVDAGVFGRLTLTDTEMGLEGSSAIFIDLYFTIADAPQVGIALLGRHEYEYAMKRLEPGQHLLVVLGNGSSTFKGSSFVRGGQFDRVRVEQGLHSLLFTDKSYRPLSGADTADAPSFKEGAVFITPPGQLDPGAPFDLVFLGSRYDGKGGFSREFFGIKSTHRMPKSVYLLDGPDPSETIWRQAWYNNRYQVVILALFLAFVAGLFAARRWLTASHKRLLRLHIAVMAISVVVLGLYFHAQPSVTQVLTLVGSAVGAGTGGEWSWGTFLSEPLLFVSWIFIAVVTIIWGRGVFCGWTCPYGAMNELAYKLGRKLKLPAYELPEKVHLPLRFLRYGVLLLLVGTFLYSSEVGEMMAEIEPFKSTFFVAPWSRQWFLFGWWLLLAGISFVWWRPFCRYLCPLGAALAIPGTFRISGPYRRAFCPSCKICTRTCEPLAIRGDGTIDSRECLSCMECEANYASEEVCPPLIGIERLTRKRDEGLAPAEFDKLKRLREEARKTRLSRQRSP